MTGKVVQLADYRKPDLAEEMSDADRVKFAVDVVADRWANELVHDLMVNFSERGDNIDFNDPVFGALMEAMANIVRSMTRHHLDVFDEIALLLTKYPNSTVSVGVLTKNEEE